MSFNSQFQVFLNFEAIPDAALWQSWRVNGFPKLDLGMGKGHTRIKKSLAHDALRLVQYILHHGTVFLLACLSFLSLLSWVHWLHCIHSVTHSSSTLNVSSVQDKHW